MSRMSVLSMASVVIVANLVWTHCAPRSLIEFYEVNSQPLADGRLANGFWDHAQQEQKQVIDWFCSDEIRKAIEMHYGLA